ncbi:glycosyltransferase family 2 protein [Spirosoma pulveris]
MKLQGSPLISVITVVFNANSTVEASMKSVLNQDKDLFEYLIIDGGSTDGTLDVIQKYEKYLTDWVSEPDKGIYDAMNKGIDRAKGQWIYFLGADDMLCEGILARIKNYLTSGVKVVYGNVKFDNGHIMRSHIGIRCLFENRLHHQSAFYHRSLFNNFRYDQHFRICADYELTLRIYLQKQPFLYIPYEIAFFASGGASDELTSNDINRIRAKYINYPLVNSIMSLMIDTYYFYFRTKLKAKKHLQNALIGR